MACPRQLLGWVREGWDPGQRMGNLQKDMGGRAAEPQNMGLLLRTPSPACCTSPRVCAPRPALWTPHS